VGSGWNWWLAPRILCLSLFIIARGLTLTTSPHADLRNEQSVEYGVKLAFIYNLAKFVEWPSSTYRSSNAPLVICIVGVDPFDPDLEDELRGRNVDGHPVQIRRLKAGDEIGACQLVFIPLTAKDQAAGIVAGLRGSSTLTVGEDEGFATRGGIINFALEGNRVHLEANPHAARRAGLRISSKLLNIVTIVKER
jgi:hypothetical protein